MWNNRQIQANFTVFFAGDRGKFEVATIYVIMASKSMQVFTERVFDITFRSFLFSEQVKIMATSANKPVFFVHILCRYLVITRYLLMCIVVTCVMIVQLA